VAKGDVKKWCWPIRRARHSIILKWLQTTYSCEVVTFTAALAGRGAEPARKKAQLLGIKDRTSSSRTCAKSSCAITCFHVPRQRALRGQYCSAPQIARTADRQKQIEIAEKSAATRWPRRDRQGQRQCASSIAYYALKPD